MRKDRNHLILAFGAVISINLGGCQSSVEVAIKDWPTMPDLEDVYCKFGFTAEAAQLLETQLGNLLLRHHVLDEDLMTATSPERARAVWNSVNRQTLGQLLKSLNGRTQTLDSLDDLLMLALRERNHLFHSFYRLHNFRRNSEEGRLIMLQDLENIHTVLLDAYKAVLLLDGIDLGAMTKVGDLPTGHLPL